MKNLHSSVLTNHRILPVAAAVMAALSASIACAEEVQLTTGPVVVTATRTDKTLAEAASSLAVVTDEDIAERGYQSFGEALLDIPNVSVQSPDSPLFSRISIRGSDSNQITYVVDGVRQDNYTLSGNRPVGVFIDPELIKQIEVKHGGGSALYGNGGIGGTLAVTTKMAGDFLEDDEQFGVLAKTGYSSTSREWQRNGYAFGRWDALDVLIGVTRRDSGETKLSNGRRSSNGTDTGYTSLLLKASLIPNDETLLSFAYNYDDYESSWLYGGTTDTQEYAFEQHRFTGTLEYADEKFFDLKANLQYSTQDYSFDQTIGTLMGLGQGNSDELDAWSGNLQNTNRFELFGQHALTYGGDFAYTEQKSLTYNPYNMTPSPDSTRPDAESWDYGLFIQDEYALSQYVSVIPVLRWSYFKREAKNADYDEFSDSKVTPGITVNVTPVKGLSFWVSAIEGFRPPVLDELYYSYNAGLPWLPDSVVDANPDLKPEKSWNYEIGMNALFGNLIAERDQLNVKAAVFYDDVKDFINIEETVDGSGISHYRAENYGHVVRKGVELTGTYVVGNFDATASYGLVHATDKETDRRITGITPQSINLKLGYTLPKYFLNGWYRLSWNDAASGDKDKNTGTGVDYDAFTTHSVGLTWTPKIPDFWDFTAGVALENITNEKFRYVNGAYGYARGVRVWVSGKF